MLGMSYALEGVFFGGRGGEKEQVLQPGQAPRRPAISEALETCSGSTLPYKALLLHAGYRCSSCNLLPSPWASRKRVLRRSCQ